MTDIIQSIFVCYFLSYSSPTNKSSCDYNTADHAFSRSAFVLNTNTKIPFLTLNKGKFVTSNLWSKYLSSWTNFSSSIPWNVFLNNFACHDNLYLTLRYNHQTWFIRHIGRNEVLRKYFDHRHYSSTFFTDHRRLKCAYFLLQILTRYG